MLNSIFTLGFGLIGFAVLSVVITMGSYLQLPCCIEKMLCPWSYRSVLVLVLSVASSAMFSRSSKGKIML